MPIIVTYSIRNNDANFKYILQYSQIILPAYMSVNEKTAYTSSVFEGMSIVFSYKFGDTVDNYPYMLLQAIRKTLKECDRNKQNEDLRRRFFYICYFKSGSEGILQQIVA